MTVDANGLEIKTIEQLLDDFESRQQTEIDTTLNVSADSPVGQFNGIIAAALREAYEALQVAYNAFDPDVAEGLLQDKLYALTGSTRLPATKGTVTCQCDLDLGTVLVAGTSFAHVVDQPDNRWTPAEDFVAPVAGLQPVPFEAENAGAVIANAGTLTVIATLTVGWNSVTNPLDAEPGDEIESNEAFRLRRERELRKSGSATTAAVRADLIDVDGIDQAFVFENTSDVVDPVTGIPPKTIEALVYAPGVLDDTIAQAIFDSKAAGIGTFGTSSGTATDSNGTAHTVNFTRATERDVWITVYPEIDQGTGYAGADALKTALAALNDTELLVGRDVIANRISEIVMSFAGVFDMTQSPELGFAAAPTGTVNLVIGAREIARLDTSRIVVNETFSPLP